jgi:hypothetical protein
MSTAATAIALCVWSKTATVSAMNPNHVPRRLIVYAAMIRRSFGDWTGESTSSR